MSLPECEGGPVLVLAPIAWGIPLDPYDTIPCSKCGCTCWMSKPMATLQRENSEAETCCAPCYITLRGEDAEPDDVLDIETKKPIDPRMRWVIEMETRRRMDQ